MIRGILSARPLHASVRFRRLQFDSRRAPRPTWRSTITAPDGGEPITTHKAEEEREDRAARAASGTTRARFITERGF